ncbi:hypothetical protein [Paraburkholderia phenazinium]|uniref:hypothetical protein n=1 Tax=Paraburkholderia phenazinium TaxID=60549 RepID=UPI00209BA99B|nr:hypothetical protein [Paraburkholderia phenazinium]
MQNLVSMGYDLERIASEVGYADSVTLRSLGSTASPANQVNGQMSGQMNGTTSGYGTPGTPNSESGMANGAPNSGLPSSNSSTTNSAPKTNNTLATPSVVSPAAGQ